MSVNFCNSQTKINLMRAFAGESQARNRYTFAAAQAHKQQLYIVEKLFKFTADQEKEHAEVFYNHLKECSGNTIHIDNAGYPVDISDDMTKLLEMAQHNEFEEADDVYPTFAKIAKDEGFYEVYTSFSNIAQVEKYHGTRFGNFANQLKNDKLFSSESSENWLCLNCGYIFEGTKAPLSCPACRKPQGYFIRLKYSTWSLEKGAM